MKMPQELDSQMIAFCGMDCTVCYKQLAERKTIKRCHGCQRDDATLPKHCRNCRIKTCAKERQLQHCFDCWEYPCLLIRNLDQSYRKRYQVSLIEQGFFLKEHGFDDFFTVERERFGCECGGIVSLHDQICSVCGKPMETTDKLLLK